MKFRFSSKRSRKTIDFGNLLPDIVSEFEINDSFIVEDLRSKWEDIAGQILASHSVPDRIFKQILFIITDHSVYANELMMMKNEILDKIISSNPAASINTIKIEIKKYKRS